MKLAAAILLLATAACDAPQTAPAPDANRSFGSATGGGEADDGAAAANKTAPQANSPPGS